MFQSIRSELFRGAAGRRRALDLRSVPRALVRPLSVSAAALLLARAEFLVGLSPFGAAFFAAGLFAGENAPALLLGTLAGAALGGLEWTSLLLPAGCALILGGFLLLDGPLRAGKFPADTALGLLAGVGVLVPGLAGKVEYAQFLHDGSEILMTEGKVDHFSEGIGLGLPLSKRAAQRIGGDLVLAPASHTGAAFILTIPIS